MSLIASPLVPTPGPYYFLRMIRSAKEATHGMPSLAAYLRCLGRSHMTGSLQSPVSGLQLKLRPTQASRSLVPPDTFEPSPDLGCSSPQKGRRGRSRPYGRNPVSVFRVLALLSTGLCLFHATPAPGDRTLTLPIESNNFGTTCRKPCSLADANRNGRLLLAVNRLQSLTTSHLGTSSESCSAWQAALDAGD